MIIFKFCFYRFETVKRNANRNSELGKQFIHDSSKEAFIKLNLAPAGASIEENLANELAPVDENPEPEQEPMEHVEEPDEVRGHEMENSFQMEVEWLVNDEESQEDDQEESRDSEEDDEWAEMREELQEIESDFLTSDEEWLPPEPKRPKNMSNKGFMQKAISNPEFSAVCMAKGQTPGAISAMAAAANFANDQSSKGISKSNIQKNHRKHEKMVGEKVRTETREILGREHGPVFIHWDEKLLPNMTNNEFGDESVVEPNLVGRMPVLATNNGGTKLLGIPKLLDGKFFKISDLNRKF